MLLFDPDAEKSLEDIIQEFWDKKLPAERKAEILAIAEAAGRTWFDVVSERMQDFLEELNSNRARPHVSRPS